VRFGASHEVEIDDSERVGHPIVARRFGIVYLLHLADEALLDPEYRMSSEYGLPSMNRCVTTVSKPVDAVAFTAVRLLIASTSIDTSAPPSRRRAAGVRRSGRS
jgi:hypothetical protein